MPAGLRLSNGPRKPIYLGEVEWAAAICHYLLAGAGYQTGLDTGRLTGLWAAPSRSLQKWEAVRNRKIHFKPALIWPSRYQHLKSMSIFGSKFR